MIRLIVPGAFPSIRISRGCDDGRVGDRGVGDRDTRDVEVGRQHGRAAGRQRHLRDSLGRAAGAARRRQPAAAGAGAAARAPLPGACACEATPAAANRTAQPAPRTYRRRTLQWLSLLNDLSSSFFSTSFVALLVLTTSSLRFGRG